MYSSEVGMVCGNIASAAVCLLPKINKVRTFHLLLKYIDGVRDLEGYYLQ